MYCYCKYITSPIPKGSNSSRSIRYKFSLSQGGKSRRPSIKYEVLNNLPPTALERYLEITEKWMKANGIGTEPALTTDDSINGLLKIFPPDWLKGKGVFKEINENKTIIEEDKTTAYLLNAYLRIMRERGKFFCASAGDEIVGICGIEKVGENLWELCKVGVDEPYQGFGIGSKLVHMAIKEASRLGANNICLVTVNSLRQAVYVYVKLGFFQVDKKFEGVNNPNANMCMDRDLIEERRERAQEGIFGKNYKKILGLTAVQNNSI